MGYFFIFTKGFTMTIFTTITDLDLWVSERAGEDTNLEDTESIVNELRNRKNFPAWGEDASDFLRSLPEYLIDIVNE
jgi:hypothetical protein